MSKTHKSKFNMQEDNLQKELFTMHSSTNNKKRPKKVEFRWLDWRDNFRIKIIHRQTIEARRGHTNDDDSLIIKNISN